MDTLNEQTKPHGTGFVSKIAEYGLSRPIGKFCEKHDLPLDFGYQMADLYIHHRYTEHCFQQTSYMLCVPLEIRKEFYDLCQELRSMIYDPAN